MPSSDDSIKKKTASRPSAAPAPASPTSSLAYYLKLASRAKVMTAEQESALAFEIVKRRKEYWSTLLCYLPYVPALCEFVAAEAEEHELTIEGLGELSQASVAVLAESNDETREAFRAARESISEQLSNVDRDAEISEVIQSDLELLNDGRALGLGSGVAPIDRNDQTALAVFTKYFEDVHRSQLYLQHVRNQFIKANLRLVISVARRLDCGLMPLQDLIQEGNLGLMKAVDRFDANRGFRFSTYASWWIRHGINRALANKARVVRLPAHVTADQMRITRATQDFEGKHGSKPTVSALAEKTGLPLVRVRKLEQVAFEPVTSLDATSANDDPRSLGDILVNPNAQMPSEKLESDGMSQRLQLAMQTLQPIEADILNKRFGLDDSDEVLTLRELGEQHSLSRERIRQLQERALSKLRGSFDELELAS